MGDPTPAGARVVVLDDALAALPIAEADLGIPWNWRIGPASRAAERRQLRWSTSRLRASGCGRSRWRMSPSHGARRGRQATCPPLDAALPGARGRQLGRARGSAAREELEAYAVEILDGATVKRTLEAGAPSAIYTAADQTADWGAPLGPATRCASASRSSRRASAAVRRARSP
jgi:hypothetical protein